MIISASRRTDIPAFYSDWFINRIKKGFFIRINPINKKQQKLISLLPEDVDAIVFWTKNPEPIIRYLNYLDAAGYNYYFQFTFNNYPPVYEPHVPGRDKLLRCFENLSLQIGRDKVIWRYDPIILSDSTDLRFHKENFSTLAAELKGLTSRCVFSFLDFYAKAQKKLSAVEMKYGLKTEDISAKENFEILRELVSYMISVSKINDMELASCAETVDLSSFDIKRSACIDGELINKMFETDRRFKKDPNQRKECLCAASIDVGMYNTCPHKCSYCYANHSSISIEKNRNKHKTTSPILTGNMDVSKFKFDGVKNPQLSFFQKFH